MQQDEARSRQADMITVEEAFPLEKFGMHEVVVELQMNETS